MAVITLISDRDVNDFFLGRLKGELLKSCHNVHIIDLAHNIKQHSALRAGFIVSSSYKNFPDNTVHIIGIDAECGNNKKHLIAKACNQYFICSNNGILNLIFEDFIGIDEIIEINECDSQIPKVPALFTFGKYACEIINGKKITEFGIKADNLKKSLPLRPRLEPDFILCHIIHIDSFKNAITNVSYDMFYQIGKGREFIIHASRDEKITEISNSYNNVKDSFLVAVFNSLGLLEIAMNKGNFTKLFNYNYDSTIRIDFF